MSYEIQALIGRSGSLSVAASAGLSIIPLKNGIELVPLGTLVRERLGIPFLPLTDEGQTSLPASIQRLCSELGSNSKVAYIEAEIFGGTGTQAFALFENGKLVAEPVTDTWAINQALNALGVESSVPETDEFDFVGLGKHRGTDQWV